MLIKGLYNPLHKKRRIDEKERISEQIPWFYYLLKIMKSITCFDVTQKSVIRIVPLSPLYLFPAPCDRPCLLSQDPVLQDLWNRIW